MRYHTKRYDITKAGGEDFVRDVKYEISLNDGYKFSDGSSLDFAESVAELRELIKDIEKEVRL